MADSLEIFQVFKRRNVPFVIVGGHAVNYHGYGRSTEDVDVVWLRSRDSERALFDALSDLEARYIGREIDPATQLEVTHPVTIKTIQTTHLMMLLTRYGFLDLFDFIPAMPAETVDSIFSSSVESEGLRYVSLPWLRRMKEASGRPKDKLDLDQLPESDL